MGQVLGLGEGGCLLTHITASPCPGEAQTRRCQGSKMMELASGNDASLQSVLPKQCIYHEGPSEEESLVAVAQIGA